MNEDGPSNWLTMNKPGTLDRALGDAEPCFEPFPWLPKQIANGLSLIYLKNDRLKRTNPKRAKNKSTNAIQEVQFNDST